MRPTFSTSFSRASGSFSRRRSGLSSINRAVLSSDRVAAVSSGRRIKLVLAVRSASMTLFRSAYVACQDHALDTNLADLDAERNRPLGHERSPLGSMVSRHQDLVQRARRTRLTDGELHQPVDPCRRYR